MKSLIIFRKTLALLLVMASAFTLNAQEVSKALGNFRSMEKIKEAVIINADGGYLKITPWNGNIVRVQISTDRTFDDFSYAVISKPEEQKYTLNEKPDRIELDMGNVKVVIHKNPVSLQFQNREGKVLDEDVSDNSAGSFGSEWFVHKKTFPGERFIGLGEKTGPLDKAGRSYTNWNSDVPGYSADQDPLYQTLPFYMGIHDSLVYGIFLDNTYRSDFCFGHTSQNPTFFGTYGGDMDYYFINGKTVADLVKGYASLTGTIKLPPLWSLGLHQSRWGYYPESEVMEIARTYREKAIPADVITLDIDYMDHYKLFTWNKAYFPDPPAMISKLKSMGFHTTVILDPGIKIEKGYSVYEDGLQKDVFIKNADGKTYFRGEVWPGMCYFPDFTNPLTRLWWGDHLKTLADDGVRGFWNDMNEPALWTKMFDPFSLNNYDGHPSTQLRAHNVYGMEMARSSYEGAVKATGERPFVLTRAGFSGVQRYAAVWTGDNNSSDEHMMLGVRLLNNLGLAGVSFCGMDIGGFTGQPDQSRKLYARFFSIGAFMPFDRVHAARDTRAQEPWAFGEGVEAVAKKYSETRYQLLPYIYSAFYESSTSGTPVQRSLALNYGFDPKIYDPEYENQYFFGPSILVAPVVSSQNFAKVYFPDDGYYDFYNDHFYPKQGEYIVEATNNTSESKLPVFVKAGSIIPMHKIIQSTNDDPGDTLFIHLYKGDRQSDYTYYEDDGISFSYLDGDYYKRLITYNGQTNKLVFAPAGGTYTSHYKYFKLIFHGFAFPPTSIGIDYKSKKGQPEINNLDLIIANDPGQMTINWK